MTMIHNEKTKLLANNLDRLSTAFIGIGVLGNSFDFSIGYGAFASALNIIIWIFSAIGLHCMARRVLGRLK